MNFFQDLFLLHDQFPHGPRTFEDRPVAAPRTFDTASKSPLDRQKRKRRSITVSDRKARSADVGVSGLYEVISEADLAFSPDSRAEAVTVFQGRIREEVVYGICMPVPGFSVLFVLVAVSAVVSALVAGSLLYRYQLQKEHLAEQARNGQIPMGLFSGWMGWRLLRMRGAQVQTRNGTDKRIRQVNGKSDETSRCE